MSTAPGYTYEIACSTCSNLQDYTPPARLRLPGTETYCRKCRRTRWHEIIGWCPVIVCESPKSPAGPNSPATSRHHRRAWRDHFRFHYPSAANP